MKQYLDLMRDVRNNGTYRGDLLRIERGLVFGFLLTPKLLQSLDDHVGGAPLGGCRSGGFRTRGLYQCSAPLV